MATIEDRIAEQGRREAEAEPQAQAAIRALHDLVLDDIPTSFDNSNQYAFKLEAATDAFAAADQLLRATLDMAPVEGRCLRLDTASPPDGSCGMCSACRGSYLRESETFERIEAMVSATDQARGARHWDAWQVFASATEDDAFDVSDDSGDVATGIPSDVAIRLAQARERFLAECREILGEHAPDVPGLGGRR